MIAVIGCGNSNRSDDGVGPEVIRILREKGPAIPGVKLLDAGTDGMAVMFSARGCETLIVIDACQSDSEPGAIFEVPGGELEQRHEPSLTMHDFRWDHALFAGHKIFREDFPQDVVVLLIEAASTGYGLGLSPPIEAAVATIVDRVGTLIEERVVARARA